jgi:hypothetical protein
MSNPMRAFTGEIRRYQLSHGKRAFVDYPLVIATQKPIRFFEGPRILLRQLVSRRFRLQAVYVREGFLTNQSIQSLVERGDNSNRPSLLSILGVLNSSLISWYFCQINTVARRDDFPKTIIKQTRELPFPDLHLDTKEGNALQDRLVAMVGGMLEARKRLAAAKTDKDKTYYEKKCASLDSQIDRLVYELYGLTEEEIRIVEGGI